MQKVTDSTAAALPTSPVKSRYIQLPVMDGLLVLTMILWGTNYSVIKSALDVLPPFVFNTLRFGVALLLTAILVRVTGNNFILPRKEWLPVFGVSFLNNGLYQSFFLVGLHYTSAVHMVLIITVAPIGVVLFNIWTKRERGSKRIAIGVVLALGGVLLVIVARYAGQFDFSGTAPLGDLLGVGAAILWAVSNLAMRGILVRSPALSVSFWTLLWGTVFMGLFALPDFLHFDWSLLKPDVINAVLYGGVVAIAFGGLVWNFGLKRLGASRTAIYANLQPIAAAAVAVLAFGEKFTIWLVIGTALTLIGMSLVRRG